METVWQRSLRPNGLDKAQLSTRLSSPHTSRRLAMYSLGTSHIRSQVKHTQSLVRR